MRRKIPSLQCRELGSWRRSVDEEGVGSKLTVVEREVRRVREKDKADLGDDV